MRLIAVVRSSAAIVRLLAFRYAVVEWRRSIATVVAIAVAISVVVSLAEVNEAIVRSFAPQTSDKTSSGQLEITAASDVGLDDSILDALVERPDIVARAVGRLERPLMILGSNRRMRVTALGVDFLAGGAAEAAEGGDIALLDEPDAVILPLALAKSLGVAMNEHLSVWVPSGERSVRVAAIASAGAIAARTDALVMSLDAAQVMFGRSSVLDAIAVTLVPGTDEAKARNELQRAVGERAKVHLNAEQASYAARTTQAIRAALALEAGLSVLVAMLLAYQATALAIASRRREIGIARATGATAAHVRFAFLVEALLIALVGAGIGVALGHGIGRFVFDGIRSNLAHVYGASSAQSTEATLTFSVAAHGVLAAVVAMLVGALAASFKTSRSPIDALLRSTGGNANGLRTQDVIAAALVVATLFAGAIAIAKVSAASSVAIGFLAAALGAPIVFVVLVSTSSLLRTRLPPVVRLGLVHAGAPTALKRNALTCAALAVAVALSLTVAIYAQSYQAVIEQWANVAVPADVLVTAGAPLIDRESIPFDATAPELRAAIKRSDPSATVLEVRSSVATIEGVDTSILATSIATYKEERARRGGPLRALAGEIPTSAKVADAIPRVVVSEGFAARACKKPGDRIAWPTPSGVHSVEIAAIVADYSSDQGWMLVELEVFRAFTHDDRVSALAIRFGAPENAAAAAAAAANAKAKANATAAFAQSIPPSFFVTSRDDVRREIVETAGRTLQLSRAGEHSMLVVALFALACAVATSVLERRRDFLLLRSIGTERPRIVLVAFVEAMLVAFAACLAGLLASIPLARVFLDGVGHAATGWVVPLSIPTLRVAVVIALLLAISALTVLPLAVKHTSRPSQLGAK